MRAKRPEYDCQQLTLLIAMTIGTPADWAWPMASLVCGRTPSSAATTMMAMSVTRVPLALIALKAYRTVHIVIIPA